MAKNEDLPVSDRPFLYRLYYYYKFYGITTLFYIVAKRFFEAKKIKSYEDYIKIVENADIKPLESPHSISFIVCKGCDSATISSCTSQSVGDFEVIALTEGIENENIKYARDINSAIEMAGCEYIAFVNDGDRVSQNAVYEIARAIGYNNVDFIYSDEDCIAGEKRYNPFFKPDWSPDTLLSFMYTGGLAVYKRDIAKKIGGVRCEYGTAWQYDFVLRFTKVCGDKLHIPKLLYHIGSEKPNEEDTKKCRDAFKGLECEKVLDRLVSIIIPSKDNYEMLKKCIDSISRLTEYQNYEIVVVDNGSSDENREKYSELLKEVAGKYHYEKMEFNFSKMCNLGSSIAKGDIFCFLNDDIEVIEPKWLDIMAEQATKPHTGAVGAKLLYPEGNFIQHCGVVNLESGPAHAFARYNDDEVCYFGRNKVDYNYIAVTAACLVVEKNKYEDVEGFFEGLEVAYNDVDFCFKLCEKGYYNVVKPKARLYHHESVSRGDDAKEFKKLERLGREGRLLNERHPNFVAHDPFFNVNLNQHNIDFSLCTDMMTKSCRVKKSLSGAIKGGMEWRLYKREVQGGIIINGWAFCKNIRHNNFNQKYIVLENEGGEFCIFKANTKVRMDITATYGKDGEFNLCGFSAFIDEMDIPKGELKAGVLVCNRFENKMYVAI